MVDPVIDEHFRRSLGADYMHLFGKGGVDPLKSSTSLDATIATTTATVNKSSQSPPNPKNTNRQMKDVYQSDDNCSSISNGDDDLVEDVEMSVDDHFAKALGDTWKQLQQHKSSVSPSEAISENDNKVNISDSDNDSNAKDDIQPSPKAEVKSGDNMKSQCHR